MATNHRKYTNISYRNNQSLWELVVSYIATYQGSQTCGYSKKFPSYPTNNQRKENNLCLKYFACNIILHFSTSIKCSPNQGLHSSQFFYWSQCSLHFHAKSSDAEWKKERADSIGFVCQLKEKRQITTIITIC